MSTTTITTSTKEISTLPEALPIVWRTSTTQLPSLPTYLVPPPIPPPTQNSNTPNRNFNETTNNTLRIYPNHNYNGDDVITESSIDYDKTQQTDSQKLLEDINNLKENAQPQDSDDYIENQTQIRDKSRLKAYRDSFPVFRAGNMSLGDIGNTGNDSDEFTYEHTLVAFSNNPFGNGRVLGKKNKMAAKHGNKQCYNSKKCNATSISPSPSSVHSNNVLDTGLSKPSDAYNPLNQPSDTDVDGDSSTEPRFKRGVIHLYNMVSCATGCNPLIYKGYGCYCGFLGSGYAVDGIDRCCKFHDWCYDTAKCPMYLEYFIPYYWKCYHRRPICAIEHGEWGGAGSCAQRLCECDRVLSECLSRYPCPSSRAICTSSPWRFLQNAFMIL